MCTSVQPGVSPSGTWTWTTKNGFVIVDGQQIALFGEYPTDETAFAKTAGWTELARRAGKKHGIPASWILGTIYAESGGNPNASNQGSGACGALGCRGLMAIHAGLHHDTRPEELFDPETNVDIGASMLAQSARLGYDLPCSASRYNAGEGTYGALRLGASPWGLCENAGYIERVVRAANTFRARGVDENVGGFAKSAFGAKQALGLAGGLAAGWLGIRQLRKKASV